MSFSGLVVVNKPQGITSHDVVACARRLFETRRVGHTGTLDPLAVGVLALCIGQATRLAEYVSGDRKCYLAGVELGIQTDTQDSTGSVVSKKDASALDQASVQERLAAFRGSVMQTPPMVSARRHQGRRLYELAREGLEVDRAPRSIRIYSLDLIEFVGGASAAAKLRVVCSAGVYIRTLAADLGEALGVGGCMSSLCREWIRSATGPFTLEQARTIEHLSALKARGRLREAVLPVAAALYGWPQCTLSDELSQRFRHGCAAPAESLKAPET
ncbi:MAG TPA: tRNA pseudouridine(55) synthase TruB, partial [Chthonomonadales bacterium]|nr:tRNA pseudouridine(55) synthase TruB [Chthonomonadales bacterium]